MSEPGTTYQINDTRFINQRQISFTERGTGIRLSMHELDARIHDFTWGGGKNKILLETRNFLLLQPSPWP